MDTRVPSPPQADSLTATPTPVVPGAGQRRPALLIIVALLLLLSAAALLAYFYLGRTAAPTYRLSAVTRGPVTASVIASGTVNPVINVQVGSQVSGQIKELYADFNSRVTKGQLIARIDPALFEAQVAQAAADLEVAKANVGLQQAAIDRAQADLAGARASLESLKAQTEKAAAAAQDALRTAARASRMAATGAGSIADRDTKQAASEQAAAQLRSAQAQEDAQTANIQSAASALEVARATLAMAQAQVVQKQAALNSAQVNLDHTYVRAPVDGTVVLRNVDVGQTVAASLQAPLLFSIAQDLRQMQVDASVDEADVGGVKAGQKATFTVDSYPGRTFQGAVQQVRIAPQVVQNVVTYDVVVSAPNADLLLLPGMTANIRLIIDHRDDALLVPNAALRYRPSGAAAMPGAAGSGEVWVLGPDGRPAPVALRLGISDGNVTEVTEAALRPGDAVITGEQFKAGSSTSAPGSPGMTAGPRF